MSTSLAAQLAQISARSKATLDVKAQKAAHSKSLIWDHKVAATQTYHSIYKACYSGFEDLCGLDARFAPFSNTLFSEQSQDEDRSTLSEEENKQLDRKIESFLRLVGSRLRLMPAIKAVEWLIRRFRIHEHNTAVLLTTFLPFHSIPAFVTLLSILPKTLPLEYRFLSPYVRSTQNPPRAAIVLQAINQPAFLAMLSEYTLESARSLAHYQTLISFWGGIMTEAINGQLDKAKTGRTAIQADNDMTLLHRVGPTLGEALVMKKVPQLQIAAYMALSVFVSKGDLGDSAVSAFMEQVVAGWTSETVRSGLICMAILSQYRSAKQVSGKVAKALLKVADVEKLLVEIGREWRIDKLANGLCLALAERSLKKSDSRGLRIIKGIMLAGILTAKQLFVLFKVLLVTAMRLDDESDKDGHMRKDIGTVLIDLSNNQGECGEVIQAAIEDLDFDMDALEMKLDMSIRRKKALDPATAADDNVEETTAEIKEDVRETLAALKTEKARLLSCLSGEAGAVFETLTRVFLLIVSSQTADQAMFDDFCKLPMLSQGSAVSDTTYITFFLRIISGAYPALARAAALDMIKNRLKEKDVAGQDFQALLPYCMAALNDPSKKVRQAATDLLVVVDRIYPDTSKPPQLPVWGQEKLYADGQKLQWLTTAMASATLRDILMPSLEECIMSHDHVCSTLEAALDSSKSSMKSSARLSLLTFLAGQVSATPSLVVKSRLLNAINRVKGVGSTTRTQLLLHVLLWWAELAPEEALRLGQRDNVDLEALSKQIVGVIVPNDAKGLESLLAILKKNAVATSETDNEGVSGEGRTGFTQAIFSRVQSMWPAMKSSTRSSIASTMLELSQATETPDAVSSESAELLRNVRLDTDILLSFLATLDMPTSMSVTRTTETPDKRRRVSLDGPAAASANEALRRATFVLQLVEGAGPANHPQVLGSLFEVLSKLHAFRSVIGSEMGYLQNLILQSILAIIPVYRANSGLTLNIPQSHGELIVNCIQTTASPVVQNSALLVIASLAATAPEVVVHVVMPVFAFVGASILRQSDDYSAYVVNQTIKEVVPPLLDSFRRGKRNPVSSAAELLLSFTASYSHVPAHRRQRLFATLVETLGAQEFLFAVVAMLVQKEDASSSILAFVGELARKYSVTVQLDTCTKLVGLVSDVFTPPPTMASALLGDALKGVQDPPAVALRQLTAVTSLLSGRRLKAQAAKAMAKDDMESAEARELYSRLLEGILVLAENLKTQETLRKECGDALASLLNLLSIGEFVKAVEGLLDRPDMGLRHRVLQALESRIDAESNTDTASRNVLLSFLPTLIATLRDSRDVRYKHTAIACVDKLAEKYGRKDIEGVLAAASTIVGDSCLGSSDSRLRVMALLCLASLVDVLQDSIVPVLPGALTRVISYLAESVQTVSKNESSVELHVACYTFVLAVAQQLPYMISASILDQLLLVSHTSASVEGLSPDASAARAECLEALVTMLEPNIVFKALAKGWAGSIKAGFAAAEAHVALLGKAIEKHSKATISKNVAPLSALLFEALDMRRITASHGQTSELESPRFSALEAAVNAVALKLIYKLNDAVFRPVFSRLIEWSATALPNTDASGRVLRALSVYNFLGVFFDALKGIVTNYATYILDDSVRILAKPAGKSADERRLHDAVLRVLETCFKNDSDEFWQNPSHFNTISPVLLTQFGHASSVSEPPATLIDATVALAGAADSQVHQKELNSALLKHLRNESAGVRLAAVLAQQKMTDVHGEEWLAMLPEMLPFIGELQEDNDETVEKETHRWIIKIETVLGENLDAMLQ
ncbi:U3 small nucleolar RNA-associated protein 10 [Ceratocystis platani]|uniref:U3 small nucleolar RNA-associated protein 10 n=1 Tax=Ceratocystis fimbriata f. sp. platani TaxID=88771 RepID=A0A0F8AZ26_CERFI|nr:U3 small nucleolar RNA-associated protein 10 [Ceratocystis platani]